MLVFWWWWSDRSFACLKRHVTKCGAGRIWTVTICRSLGPICGSMINVGLGLGLGFGLGFELGLWIGSGLRIVVYKLLEKVTKCGSITWLNRPMACHPADPLAPHFVMSRLKSYSWCHCHIDHFLLQQHPEWFVILVLAYSVSWNTGPPPTNQHPAGCPSRQSECVCACTEEKHFVTVYISLHFTGYFSRWTCVSILDVVGSNGGEGGAENRRAMLQSYHYHKQTYNFLQAG